MSLLNTEFQLYDLDANLTAEICSYLEVHDQVNMKRICRWWRLTLSETYLSRLVKMDGFRMMNQSEKILEHALDTCLQKNTKILVLKHIAFETGDKFGIVVQAIKQKEADLILLILEDCTVKTEYAGTAWYWLNPQKAMGFVLQGLLFATKKLVLVNYTIWNVMSGVFLSRTDPMMPCKIPRNKRRFSSNELPLPVVIARHEFDCTKPFLQHYHAFIMTLNSSCPEVDPKIRDAVVQLYSSWIYSDAQEYQWDPLGRLIKCLQEGVPVPPYSDDFHVDILALRQLDPLTLNKLVMEALYRLYF